MGLFCVKNGANSLFNTTIPTDSITRTAMGSSPISSAPAHDRKLIDTMDKKQPKLELICNPPAAERKRAKLPMYVRK